jgi:hypothetical protein
MVSVTISMFVLIVIIIVIICYILKGGSSWTKTTAPEATWNSITSDSSGLYLAAVQYRDITWSIPGFIYTSSDGMEALLLFQN